MFRGLLDKVKGCKYQITVKGLLRKDKKKKKKREIEFTPIILILLLKQYLMSNMILTNLFKKFSTEFTNGLMKDLVI